MNRQIDGILENWAILDLSPSYKRIVGTIYGDTKGRFHDGAMMITSAVIAIYKDENLVRTRNSTYKLGKKFEEGVDKMDDES